MRKSGERRKLEGRGRGERFVDKKDSARENRVT